MAMNRRIAELKQEWDVQATLETFDEYLAALRTARDAPKSEVEPANGDGAGAAAPPPSKRKKSFSELDEEIEEAQDPCLQATVHSALEGFLTVDIPTDGTVIDATLEAGYTYGEGMFHGSWAFTTAEGEGEAFVEGAMEDLMAQLSEDRELSVKEYGAGVEEGDGDSEHEKAFISIATKLDACWQAEPQAGRVKRIMLRLQRRTTPPPAAAAAAAEGATAGEAAPAPAAAAAEASGNDTGAAPEPAAAAAAPAS